MADTNTRGSTSPGQDSGDSSTKPEFKTSQEEDYGYFFYPERGGGAEEKSMWQKILSGKKTSYSLKCLANVHWCLRNGDFSSKFKVVFIGIH